MNGIINIFKPEGLSSFGVIKEVKKLTGEKKIGHIGTLDPLAEGVLPLFLGKYTKLIPFFNIDRKTYIAKAKLGAYSTTMDREGDVTEVPIPEIYTEASINETLNSFLGDSEQIPPMFSAVKIKGKKLYEYAREGKEVERKSRKITIHRIKLNFYQLPEFDFEVCCSKGTYIRTLVDDIGIKLGTRAYLLGLTRTQSGRFFSKENAIDLDLAKKMDKSDLQSHFIDPKYILFDWHDVQIDSQKQQTHISQGRTIPVSLDKICFSGPEKQVSKAIARSQNGELLATGFLEFSQDTECKFKPEKVFI